MPKPIFFPQSKWAQNHFYITLSIFVKDHQTPKVNFGDKDELIFTSETERVSYSFNEPLYGQIDTSKSGTKQAGQWLEIKLKKKNPEEQYWKHIFKNPNIKVQCDWDKWTDEDELKDMAEGDFDPEKLMDVMRKNGELSDDEQEEGPPQEGEEQEEDSEEEEYKDLETRDSDSEETQQWKLDMQMEKRAKRKERERIEFEEQKDEERKKGWWVKKKRSDGEDSEEEEYVGPEDDLDPVPEDPFKDLTPQQRQEQQQMVDVLMKKSGLDKHKQVEIDDSEMKVKLHRPAQQSELGRKRASADPINEAELEFDVNKVIKRQKLDEHDFQFK